MAGSKKKVTKLRAKVYTQAEVENLVKNAVEKVVMQLHNARNTATPAQAQLEDGSVALAAHKAIHGAKKEAYGPVTTTFHKIATIASIYTNKPINGKDIARILMAVKIVREAHKHNRDNLLDFCGYADLLQQLYDAEPSNVVTA